MEIKKTKIDDFWEVKIKKDNKWIPFIVKVSARKNKKYDVYQKQKDKELKYILSFGDKRYTQYKDRLGYYDINDHGDLKRRNAYHKRHGSHEDNIYSAKYWSHELLW